MDGDQIARADELIELDVVDVAAAAQLGGVQHDEDVVAVGAHLGHGVALDARPDGEGMEAEGLRQDPGGRFVTDRDIDPDQPVVAVQQGGEVLDRVLVDAFIGYQENVDSGCHANVHPARTSSDQRLPPHGGHNQQPVLPSVRMVGPDGPGQ